MSQSSDNPFVWVNPNRTHHCQPTSQSHQMLGPGSNRSRSMGLSVTFGVSGGLIQSREPRITFPQEQLHRDDLPNILSQIEEDEESSVEGLRAPTHNGSLDDGQLGKWVGMGEAFQTEVKIKLEEEEQAIMNTVESAHDPERRIKVEETDDQEEIASSCSQSTVDSKAPLSALREEQRLLRPEQISHKVFSSSSKIPVHISVKSESPKLSKRYPGHTLSASAPRIPFAAPHNMMWPTRSSAPRLPLPPPFPVPSLWRHQSAPRAFVPAVNRCTIFPPVRTVSNIEGPKANNNNKKKKMMMMTTTSTKKEGVAVSSELRTVWQMTKLPQFGQKLGLLCLKREKTRDLKNFLKLGAHDLLIGQLPRGKPDDELMSYLDSTLQTYAPPDWLLEFYYMMEVGVAIVALPPGKFARDVVQCSSMKPYQGKTFPMRVLKDSLGTTPLKFFRAMMKIIDESAAVDGAKTVFFETIAEEEVAELKNIFKNSQAVQYFMPLYNKLFIQFSTLEDADQFGLRLSRKSLRMGKRIYRLGFTRCRLVECSRPPFWVTIPMYPFMFPTVTSSFIIPEHKTVRGVADIEAMASKGDCGNFRTVMFTNLPPGCNAHCAIKKRVQSRLTNVTPQFDNYCVIVLPLQRRAFVHFEDWESCFSFLRDFKNPKLCLHLVKSMCPQYNEDAMYQSLMALSNNPVHNSHSLSERLLVVSVEVEIKIDDLRKLMDKVTSVGPFASFLPLGNRICIEMENSEDVTQLVENYQAMSYPQKYAMWPITNFESCQDMTRRLNLASERQTEELQSEAVFPPSDHEVEPARSDVTAPVNTPAGATEPPVSAEIQESELDIDVNSRVVLGEEVEYQMIDSGADETPVTTKRENSSNWDVTASSMPAADTKEEPLDVEYKELHQSIDKGGKDAADDCGNESSGSSWTGEKKRNPVLLEKRKSEMAGPEAKRPCPPAAGDTAAFKLPAFTPNDPLGQDFIRLRSGFSCSLCSVFVLSRSAAEEHCCSQMHHANLKNYYLKLQHAG